MITGGRLAVSGPMATEPGARSNVAKGARGARNARNGPAPGGGSSKAARLGGNAMGGGEGSVFGEGAGGREEVETSAWTVREEALLVEGVRKYGRCGSCHAWLCCN